MNLQKRASTILEWPVRFFQGEIALGFGFWMSMVIMLAFGWGYSQLLTRRLDVWLSGVDSAGAGGLLLVLLLAIPILFHFWLFIGWFRMSRQNAKQFGGSFGSSLVLVLSVVGLITAFLILAAMVAGLVGSIWTA